MNYLKIKSSWKHKYFDIITIYFTHKTTKQRIILPFNVSRGEDIDFSLVNIVGLNLNKMCKYINNYTIDIYPELRNE